MEPAKNEDADKDAAIARRRKLSLPPPTVKLIEESDLLQQSLYQGGGGVGASRQDQHEVRPGSDAHIARSKNLLCICMLFSRVCKEPEESDLPSNRKHTPHTIGKSTNVNVHNR